MIGLVTVNSTFKPYLKQTQGSDLSFRYPGARFPYNAKLQNLDTLILASTQQDLLIVNPFSAS